MITSRTAHGLQHREDLIQKVEMHENVFKSILYIDSDNRITEDYSIARYQSSNILQSNVSKIGVKKVDIRYDIPNINSYNNILSFYSEVEAQTFTVILDIGHYNTAALMAHIVSVLNASASSIVFTGAASGESYTITGTTAFRFVQCSHIEKAKPLTGLYITQSITSITVRPRGLYTEYIDFVISELKDGQIIGNLFTKDNRFSEQGHIIRVLLTGEQPGLILNLSREITNIQYNLIRKKQLNSLNIEVYDQWGEALYREYLNDKAVDYFGYRMEISVMV